MAQSSPHPISATEFAVMPAVMPRTPSMANQTNVIQDSCQSVPTPRGGGMGPLWGLPYANSMDQIAVIKKD